MVKVDLEESIRIANPEAIFVKDLKPALLGAYNNIDKNLIVAAYDINKAAMIIQQKMDMSFSQCLVFIVQLVKGIDSDSKPVFITVPEKALDIKEYRMMKAIIEEHVLQKDEKDS